MIGGEPITEGRQPAVIKPAYSSLERLKNVQWLLSLYMRVQQGKPAIVPRALVDWFYWETHGNAEAGPVINETMAVFIANHSSGVDGEVAAYDPNRT